jgi:hypothetical protein
MISERPKGRNEQHIICWPFSLLSVIANPNKQWRDQKNMDEINPKHGGFREKAPHCLDAVID